MKKLFPPYFFLIVLVQPLSAQVSIGNRVGVSMFKGSFSADTDQWLVDVKQKSSSVTGASVAIPIEIKISDHFALQPEVGYTMKGNAYESFMESMTITKLNYVDLTLLAKGIIGSGKLKAELMLGPGFAYGSSVRQQVTQVPAWYYGSDRTSNFQDASLSSNEFYLAGGAGISYSIGIPRIFINYRYVYGITNIHGTVAHFNDITGSWTADIAQYNRGSIVSLGFLIPLSRSAWGSGQGRGDRSTEEQDGH